ncbi:MAG: YitT family protein [Lachnospira sp.]|nr:YitT family protein [Lachnospira sp.]
MAGYKKRSLQLVIGTFFMAIAYKSIYDSVQMVTGGFSGIGVIVRHLTMGIVEGGIPMWVTNVVLNVPLFIASYIIKGRKFVADTVVGTALLTVFLAVLPSKMPETTDYLIAAVTGGVLYGLGIGLVLSAGATTGGTDMLAVLLTKVLKGYSIVRIMQIIDGLIIVAGMVVFGIRISLYAMIAIYIGTIVSDRIVEGAKSAKAVWIISDNYREIAQGVMKELVRGATLFKGNGMYSDERRNVLLCVVSKKQIPRLKEIAQSADNKVFIIIGDVREVWGEGFVKITH